MNALFNPNSYNLTRTAIQRPVPRTAHRKPRRRRNPVPPSCHGRDLDRWACQIGYAPARVHAVPAAYAGLEEIHGGRLLVAECRRTSERRYAKCSDRTFLVFDFDLNLCTGQGATVEAAVDDMIDRM